jgi:hypothetical protein
MKHRPRPLFRNRPGPTFDGAMLEVAAEDLLASPCIMCDRPGNFVAQWLLTAECIARELGGDPTKSRTMFYRLCDRCARRFQRDKPFVTRVENTVLKLWRAGDVHRITDTVERRVAAQIPL